jgi:hypothetical protein
MAEVSMPKMLLSGPSAGMTGVGAATGVRLFGGRDSSVVSGAVPKPQRPLQPAMQPRT